MRPNRYAVFISLVVGVFGVWFAADAVAQYLNTTRSFTSVYGEYVENSFVWLDPEHQEGVAQLRIVNDAPNDVTVAYLSASLYFDGDFAGARYRPWDPISIPAGDDLVLDVPFTVSISSLQPRGSDAELSYGGEMRLEFEDIEQPMTVRMSGTIGQVPYQEVES